MTVAQIMELINQLAPFDTQEAFDNSGLLTGHPSWEARGLFFALDVTEPVIEEAAAAWANVLITHHPLMFSPRKAMTETDYEGRLLCRLIRERMALIAVHTNLDQAPGGINDSLAGALGLADVQGEGYVRVGRLPEGLTAGTIQRYVEARLGDTARVMGSYPPERPLKRLGLCSGAGSEFWEEAARLGAEVFLTGEMKHHHALALVDAGLMGLECGHYATEAPGIFALADALQTRLVALKWECSISRARCARYTPPGNA